MKRIVFNVVFLVFLFAGFEANGQDIDRKQGDNGKWGFVDKTGNVVIPFKYDDALSCFGGLCSVKINGKWGYIDKDGTEVIPFKYDFVGLFINGHAEVGIIAKPKKKKPLNDKSLLYGFIDETGTEIVPIKFNGAKANKEFQKLFPSKNSCDPSNCSRNTK